MEGRTDENRFGIFVIALDYIEQNLCTEFSQESIAAACYCSLSSLQKLWRYCTHTSIKTYISKRRLTLAARALLEEDITALDAAMRFGYNSPEVFTRAFTKFWGMPPSKFRKQWKGSAMLYPRLDPNNQKEDQYMSNIRKFDVSELYDYLRERAGTYVLCFDVQELMRINNELGREAGDKALLETMRRINEAAGEDMLSIRLGGDEFALVTGSGDMDMVIAIAEDVLSHNGETVPYSGGNVAVSLRCGVIKISTHLKYSVLCSDFKEVLERSRETGRIEFK